MSGGPGTQVCGQNFTGPTFVTPNFVARISPTRVDLIGAYLVGASLRAANLIGANMKDARVGWTTFGSNDLSAVNGLEEVKHGGPSTIGIDTLYASRGKIPEVFLRGAGLPDIFIDHIGTLLGTPSEFYSCFISYSSKDQKFAERLRADLQARGVRCWFAPEDLKTGDAFRSRIDEAIRRHDKLLLILSKNSIASGRVQTEAEKALHLERQRKTANVLLPVRLDKEAVESEAAWACDIRLSRHIGDFSRWRNPEAYAKWLDRLLHDLQASDEAR